MTGCPPPRDEPGGQAGGRGRIHIGLPSFANGAAPLTGSVQATNCNGRPGHNSQGDSRSFSSDLVRPLSSRPNLFNPAHPDQPAGSPGPAGKPGESPGRPRRAAVPPPAPRAGRCAADLRLGCGQIWRVRRPAIATPRPGTPRSARRDIGGPSRKALRNRSFQVPTPNRFGHILPRQSPAPTPRRASNPDVAAAGTRKRPRRRPTPPYSAGSCCIFATSVSRA